MVQVTMICSLSLGERVGERVVPARRILSCRVPLPDPPPRGEGAGALIEHWVEARL